MSVRRIRSALLRTSALTPPQYAIAPPYAAWTALIRATEASNAP